MLAGWLAVLVLSGWRETTPAVGTADNPAYDNNRAKQEISPSLALLSTKQFAPIERDCLARTQPPAHRHLDSLLARHKEEAAPSN